MAIIIISQNEMTFYDIDDYINQVGGGVLINFSNTRWTTEGIPDGSYWSGTKISCSRQAVVILDNGSKRVEKWDKTFRAKAVVLK